MAPSSQKPQKHTGNPNTRGQASNPASNSKTNRSDHVRRHEEHHDENTEFHQVSRTVYPPDGQLSSSNITLDRQSRTLPDPPKISGTGSRPSTASSNSHVPRRPHPSPVHLNSCGKVVHSRDHSTWSTMDASSSSSHRQQFTPGYRGTSFDRASQTSTQSSLKSRVSDLWSRFSIATSLTSLSTGRSRAKTPKLNLEIPSHLLSMDPLLGNNNFIGGQEAFRQTSEASSALNNNAPQHSTSFDQNQSILLLRAEPPQSAQINSANDSLQDISPIGQAMQSKHRIFHVGNAAITSGTLEGLVHFIIVGFGLPGHTRYRDTFLTACSELTTPENLFQILLNRLSEEHHTSNDGSSTQYTIFMFIIYWLKSNCFPPNEELLYRIKFSCEDAIRQYPPLDSIANETRQLIDLKLSRPAPLRASKPDGPILKASDITPRDLAIALSILEGDHYKALQPSDYLQHLSKGQSDKVNIYIKTNEQIMLWVIKSILYYDTVSNRSQVVKFYISTALECYSMRNFSSTAAISTALQSVYVENLKATMKATRRALSQRNQAKLPAIYDIVHPHSNHRGYYDAIQSAATDQELDTCIPWLPVHLKELDKVVRQPLTVVVDNQHLVNFTRHNRFMDRINEILYYSPPDLEDKRHGGQLKYLLNQLRDIDLSGKLERQLSAKSETYSTQESWSKGIDENLKLVGFAVP